MHLQVGKNKLQLHLLLPLHRMSWRKGCLERVPLPEPVLAMPVTFSSQTPSINPRSRSNLWLRRKAKRRRRRVSLSKATFSSKAAMKLCPSTNLINMKEETMTISLLWMMPLSPVRLPRKRRRRRRVAFRGVILPLGHLIWSFRQSFLRCKVAEEQEVPSSFKS